MILYHASKEVVEFPEFVRQDTQKIFLGDFIVQII